MIEVSIMHRVKAPEKNANGVHIGMEDRTMTEMIIDLILALGISFVFAAGMFILWCYLCTVYEDKLLEESDTDEL